MVVQVSDLFPSFGAIAGPNPTISGTDMNRLVQQLFSYASGITPTTTVTITAATPLTSAINELTSTNTVGYAVALPIGLPGSRITIINDGAGPVTVFGYLLNPNTAAADTIAAHGSTSQAATATGVTQASASIASYTCFSAGKWKQFLTS
jgi:hypothetical protein